ncbi:MAG: hypothetical protein U0797_30150 [Gemmataceae bacterium]
MVGLVVAMDRETGTKRVRHAEPPADPEGRAAFAGGVTTYIAWSPDGKYTVHGTQHGEVFWWYPTDSKNPCHRFAGEAGNWVRLLAFVSKDHQLLVVTRNGKAWLYDAMKPKLKPRPVALPRPKERSSGQSCPPTSGAAGGSPHGHLGHRGEDGKVELLTDFAHLKAGGDGRPQSDLDAHKVKVARRPPAWRSTRTARPWPSACRRSTASRARSSPGPSAGVIHPVEAQRRRAEVGAPPGVPGRLRREQRYVSARAGRSPSPAAQPRGRLFDLANEAVPLSEVRSPGAHLWSVGLSEDGRHLAGAAGPNSDAAPQRAASRRLALLHPRPRPTVGPPRRRGRQGQARRPDRHPRRLERGAQRRIRVGREGAGRLRG